MDGTDNQEASDEVAKPIGLPDRTEQQVKSRRLTRIGFVLTVIYLGAVLTFWFGTPNSIVSLEPNEFGDFLAGTFAPLAFLWLVLGFLQQGHELRHSADALWLQGEELRNSVEQQRDLVNVTREQLKFESQMLDEQRQELARASQPQLTLQHGSRSHVTSDQALWTFNLVNLGRTCTAVAVRSDDRQKAIAQKHILDKGEGMQFRMTLPNRDLEPFLLTVTFIDERSFPGEKVFQVSQRGESLVSTPVS